MKQIKVNSKLVNYPEILTYYSHRPGQTVAIRTSNQTFIYRLLKTVCWSRLNTSLESTEVLSCP